MGKESMWLGVHDSSRPWLGGVPAVLWGHVCSVHVSVMSGNGMESGEGGGSRTESMVATERRAQWQKGEHRGGKERAVVARRGL